MEKAIVSANRALASAVSGRPMGADELTKDQVSAVGYFFLRLRDFDPERFDRMYPDNKSKAVAKRVNAPFVMNMSADVIDGGFAKLKLARQADPEFFRFWTVDDVLGFFRNGGKKAGEVHASGMYRPFPRDRSLEDQGAKQRRKATAEKTLSKILGELG